MERPETSERILSSTMDCGCAEDCCGEPDPTQVRTTSTVQPDNPTVSVRGRREQEDVSVVEGTGTLIDPWGRHMGETTYRRWKEEME